MGYLDEFDYLMNFARKCSFNKNLCCEQLRCLWTAYCFHQNILINTIRYDDDFEKLWNVVSGNNLDPNSWRDFELFDNFMSKYL